MEIVSMLLVGILFALLYKVNDTLNHILEEINEMKDE